jgi:hypothetical protein
MKNLEEQLNILQKTVMNTEEKGAIRDAVVSYMQENPQKTIAVRNREDKRLRYRTSNFNNSLISFKNMTIAIIIALLLGGGTSFAAENALPGDVLYPIKIHVNENVQELAAVSDKAEAKVQAKLATRRLEEAEKLAVSGRLNAETSADLKTRFEEHSQKSKEHRTKVEEGDDAEVAANISSDTQVSLGIHQRLIEDIEDSKPEMKGFLDGILGGVSLRLKEAGDDRLDTEVKVFAGGGSDAKAAAEGTLIAAQNKIDEVKKFIESRKSALSASVQAQADVHLKAADAAVAEGKAKIEAQAYADAFALFKKAEREAQGAKLFVVTTGNLGVEIEHSDDADGLDDDPNYWTEERMRDAQPVPNGRIVPSPTPAGEDGRNGREVEGEGSIDIHAEAGGTSGNAGANVEIGL